MLGDTQDKQQTNQDAPKTETELETKPGGESFTQEDVNRIAAERAKRAQATAEANFLAALGGENLESVKAALEKARKLEEAQLTETERLQKELEAVKAERQKAEQMLVDMRTEVRDRARANAVSNALRNAGAQDTDNLMILVAAKHADAMNSVFDGDESAEPNASSLASFVKQIQSGLPSYFASAGAGSPSNAGGTPPTPLTEARKLALEEIQRKHGKL